MTTHDLDFGHRRPDVLGPICRICGQAIDAEQWARHEPCSPPGLDDWDDERGMTVLQTLMFP